MTDQGMDSAGCEDLAQFEKELGNYSKAVDRMKKAQQRVKDTDREIQELEQNSDDSNSKKLNGLRNKKKNSQNCIDKELLKIQKFQKYFRSPSFPFFCSLSLSLSHIYIYISLTHSLTLARALSSVREKEERRRCYYDYSWEYAS